MNRPLRLLLLLLVLSTPASAQISFELDYVSGQVGQTFQPSSASASSGQEAAIQALAALTGANQTWDFSALTFDAPGSNPVIQEYISLPDASLAGSGDARVATATYAIKGVTPGDTPGDYYVTYHQLDGTGHRTFGTMIIDNGQTTDNLYSSGLFDHPIPLAYGDTWTGSTTYTTTTGGFASNIAISRDGDANGWGTLVTPQGSAQALRYEYNQTLTTTVFGFSSSVTTRLILFATKAGFSAGITITNAGQGDVITATHTWNAYGTEVSVDPPATSPTSLGPASGTTGVSTSPTLSWGAVDGATAYDLQVSTEAFGKNSRTIVIDETGLSGTSYAASGLDESTTYFWRVRGTNSGGAGAWSDAISFTTLTSPPAAVTLVSPASGATGVAVSTDLTWSATATATTYDLQVATDAGFATLVSDQTGLAGTTASVSGLAHATVHFWRVRGVNAGGAGPWTESSFTTEAAAVVLPGTITLTTPAQGATSVDVSPTLRWQAASDAATYDVQVATDAAFTAPVVQESGLAGLELGVTGLAYATTYHWRVRGVNADGNGPWTAASFTTGNAPLVLPGAVVLTAPANAATDIPEATTLSWQAASDAATYDVQVATSAEFTSPVVAETGLAATQLGLTGLSASTTYFWRVRGVNADGNGAWTSASFTTAAPALQAPGAVVLSLPADGATDVEATLTLSWSAAADAAGYDIEVATDAAFQTVVVTTTTAGTEVEVGPLAGNTAHWWRVRGTNAAGAGPWTAASFTTVSGVATEQGDGVLPEQVRLHAAYPNPFNPQTAIGFDVPTTGHVRLSVWDVTGRRVAVLVDRTLPAGRYLERFQASELPSGTYIVRLEAIGVTRTSAISLLR